MINLPCLFFADKNKYYANELICIFEYRMKGQCLSFKLVPICHSMLSTGCDMINLLCIPSLFKII